MDANQVVILKANFALRMKIGEGGVAPRLLLKCRQVMEENAYDFIPMGRQTLKTIRTVLKKCRTSTITKTEALEQLRIHLMLFKANAAIFHHPLLSDIAQKNLDFLEKLEELDELSLTIVQGFHDTAEKLLAQRDEKLRKASAHAIPEEFERAFERYWQRKKTS